MTEMQRGPSSRCRARRASFRRPRNSRPRALINDAAAYEKLYRRSIDDPEGFWAETARAELTWIRDFKKVLDWKLPYSKWFEDGS